MTAPTSTYRRNPETVGTQIEDEVILMSLEAGNFHTITGPMASIWICLKTPQTQEQLVENLTQEFEIDTATCAKECEKLLAEMQEAGLVEK